MFPVKYLPKRLSIKDRKKQRRGLLLARKSYKRGKYVDRPRVKTFKSVESPHIKKAKRIYKLKTMKVGKELAKRTGCSKKCLKKIVKKGMGAYYSSGSRPNQSGSSWGIARLASSITGGKAAAVDYKILEEGCKKGSRALNLARKSRNKHGYGKRKVPKTR
jgi:hypothetical protein|tara:strand:- start:27 stop:509 length:483 start_codon:yes stop_codon:yes gene_type:complete